MAATPNTDSTPPSALRRVGWFVVIWATSAAAVAIFAYGLRAIFQL